MLRGRTGQGRRGSGTEVRVQAQELPPHSVWREVQVLQ